MAKMREPAGNPEQGAPGKRKYDPEERLSTAATVGRKCIESIRNGEDVQTAYALLKDNCVQLEKLIWDGTHTGLFDDSHTRSGYRGKRYRDWICAQCAVMLALQYRTMGDYAIQLGQKDVIGQYIPRMLSYAESADKALRTSETLQILLSILAAAGDWCLHQLEPPDPKRAFQYSFRLLQTVEQLQDRRPASEEVVLPLMEDAAKTIYESVTMAPALAKNLNEAFTGVFPLAKKTGYDSRHILICANLQADLLDWMLDHGETWRGPWQGEDAPFERVYVDTVRGLINKGVMRMQPHFRQQVLRVLGKMQDELEQIDLAKEVLQYCDSHHGEKELEDTVRLVEEVRDIVSRDGRYNCHPLIWIYVDKSLSDAYIQADRYDDVDVVAVQTLQDVAELRQPDCAVGKWRPKEFRDKGMSLVLMHILTIAESNAYLKRAAVSNHYDRPKEALAYMDQAEAVLDQREETDRLYPELREQVHFLRISTLEAYSLEELEGEQP